MTFKKGDKVKIWGDPTDIAIVTGISSTTKDNQGNPLIQLNDGSEIAPQVLTRAN